MTNAFWLSSQAPWDWLQLASEGLRPWYKPFAFVALPYPCLWLHQAACYKFLILNVFQYEQLLGIKIFLNSLPMPERTFGLAFPRILPQTSANSFSIRGPISFCTKSRRSLYFPLPRSYSSLLYSSSSDLTFEKYEHMG